jgi:hypothetical protein
MHVSNDTADPFYPSLKAGAYASKKPNGHPCDFLYLCLSPAVTLPQSPDKVYYAFLGVPLCLIFMGLWMYHEHRSKSRQTDNTPPGIALSQREDDSGNTSQSTALQQTVGNSISVCIDNLYLIISQDTTLRRIEESPDNILWGTPLHQTEDSSDSTSQGSSTIFHGARPL